MISKRNKAIFTNIVKESNLTFNYIDVGARGDISSPWSELEEKSIIVGFEPDSKESQRLNSKFKNRKYFDIALWSEQTNKDVYINEWESTSSMYKPNSRFIEDFEEQHWKGRKPKFTANVQCDTLDSILQENNIVPDFIKIDTQGAELEILKGAESLLINYSPMVTCELWCAEVYKNAPLMHEVIEYMTSLGYQIFDMEISAAWRYNKEQKNNKRRVIGYEVLFVKVNDIKDNKEQFLKFILLLELYGYRDYAILLLNSQEEDYTNIIESLVKNQNAEFSFFNNIFNKIINNLNKVFKLSYRIYPNIKY